MWFRYNKLFLGKILLLLVILLVIGLSGFGCAGIRSVPEGGSGAAIADGTLFLAPVVKSGGGFGCTPSPMKGKLVAVDASDGTSRWELPLESSRSAGGGFGCTPTSTAVAIYGTPAVAGELVYVGSYDGKIYAVNISSGALRWVYPREGYLQPIVGGPVVALGKVYFGCADGKVYALDAPTGDKEWEFETGDKIWSTPIVDGDTLYVGSFDNKLYALDVTDGSQKWEPFQTEGAIISTPVVYNNTVYFGSFDRHLYAVNITNGKLVWVFPATDDEENKPENWFWTRPLAYNNVIYAGCLDHKLYGLEAGSGEKVAEFDLGSPIVSWPVLVDGKVVIASQEGKIYALDTGNNQITPLAEAEEKIYAPLGAGEGVAYVHTQGGVLYEVDAQTGAMRQLYTIKEE